VPEIDFILTPLEEKTLSTVLSAFRIVLSDTLSPLIPFLTLNSKISNISERYFILINNQSNG